MKKAFIVILAVLAAASAVVSAGCGLISIEPVGEPDVINNSPEATQPEETAAPTPAPTQAPTPEPTEEPTPTPDASLLVLVNFDHPIYEEPEVVLLSDYLTAENVTCDERRHADERAAKALNDMLLAAQREGDFHFIIASAFRSIWEQEVLWAPRVTADPDYGADPYSEPVVVMPPNCSEHTTGLAFDILCNACPHADPLFASSAEGRWLIENASKFGFILRFPEDKQHITGVVYEPWHFRYVGVDAAEYITQNGLCLEEFLGEVHGE